MKRQTTLFNNQSGPACQTRLWYRCLLKSVLIIILMGIIVTVQACSKDEEQNEEQIPPKVSEDPLPNPPENVEFIQSVSVGSNHEILVMGPV